LWPEKHFLIFKPRFFIQLLILFYGWFAGFCLVNVSAQDRTSVYADIVIPPIVELKVENKQTFPEPSVVDMKRGSMELQNAVRLIVHSNSPWKISIYSRCDNLYITPNAYKPIQDFQWRTTGGTYQSISRSPVTVITGNQGVVAKEIFLDYRLLLRWENTPPGHWEFEPIFDISPWESDP
jgi:hypothetical protein